MQTVLLNIGVLCFVLALWTASGIGPVLLLAPKTRFFTWLLLSPLIGLLLIVSIGVARLEFLLWPANPLVDCSVLASFGLLVLYLRRKRLRPRFGRLYPFALRLCGPYLAFLVLYSLVFGTSGFETLSTGSDEVAYGMLDEEIIQNVHRGTPLDNPIMRLDHYIQDYPAKDLVFLKNFRRGSDMLTVATSMLLGIRPQRIYPVTFGCLTLMLSMAVLFLCRNGFNLKVSLAWPVPLFYLVSAGLWTLNIQGNFSNLSSWALFLLAPWFLMQSLERVRLRWVFPFALMVSSIYSLYYEPTILSLVVPCLLITLYCIVRQRTSLSKLLAVAAITTVLVFVLDPTFVEKLAQSLHVAQKYPNIQGFVRNLIAGRSSGAQSGLGEMFSSWRSLARSDWWPHIANVLFGIASSIDVSRLNLLLRVGVATMPVMSLLGIYFTIVIACFGMLAGRHVFGVISSVVMLGWFASTHLFALEKVFFTFYRSVMFAMPYLLLGLGLAFCRARMILERSSRTVRYLALLPLCASLGFLLINSFTSAALGAYVHSHSVCDDGWIRRLNPDAPIWRDLRSTLAESPAPVLISGMTEPTRILWLGSGIKPLAHFMGKSTSDNWLFGVHATPDQPFYPTRPPTPQDDWVSKGFGGGDREGWYVKGPSTDLMPVLAKQNIPWNKVYPGFVSQSEMALVPIRHGWPTEWNARTDIIGPMTIEFTNVSDVVYRRRDAVSISGPGLGPLASDDLGRYRELTGDTLITARPTLGWIEVSILFDGVPADLALRGQPLTRVDQDHHSIGATESFFRLKAPVQSVDLTLAGKAGIRIRDISMRVVPEALGCRPAFEP